MFSLWLAKLICSEEHVMISLLAVFFKIGYDTELLLSTCTLKRIRGVRKLCDGTPPTSPPPREPIKKKEKAAWSGWRRKAANLAVATLLLACFYSSGSSHPPLPVEEEDEGRLASAACRPVRRRSCCAAACRSSEWRQFPKNHPERHHRDHQQASQCRTAGHNPYFANYTIEQFKHILGVKPTPPGLLASIPTKTYSKSKELPKEFDARTKWSGCSTIGKILDQGHCGACWAFGAVECLQDRFCIHQSINISLSVNDLVACCGDLCGDGCDGGYPIGAWQYFVENGVVTDECYPYFDQDGCQHPGCTPEYHTPACEKKCKVQNQVWQEKKHFSVDGYFVNSDPHDIMAEVYENGPVEVAFIVYEDFAHYKTGVYKHITGGEMGGHAAKLIGWGTSDAGEDYWLLANQWNTGWGDDGYFKIIRGKNECGIEGEVVAGMPKNITGDHGRAFGTAIL